MGTNSREVGVRLEAIFPGFPQAEVAGESDGLAREGLIREGAGEDGVGDGVEDPEEEAASRAVRGGPLSQADICGFRVSPTTHHNTPQHTTCSVLYALQRVL